MKDKGGCGTDKLQEAAVKMCLDHTISLCKILDLTVTLSNISKGDFELVCFYHLLPNVNSISTFIFTAHHPDRPPPSFYCYDCYSKMIKEGRADPEMFEDINHPISQVQFAGFKELKTLFSILTKIKDPLYSFEFGMKLFFIL